MQQNKRVWDNLILVVLLYSIVMEPFRIGLGTEATGFMYQLDMTLSVLFLFDILFTFNTAYLETHLEGDNWVIDRGMIAQNYFAWRFYIELPSAYPAELVDLMAVHFEWAMESKSWFRLLRLLRLLRVVRVLRELNVIYAEVLLWFESRLQANLAAFHLAGPLTILVYLMHLLACSFVFAAHAAQARGYEHSWMLDYDDGAANEGGLRQQYLIALYWASGTATGLGTGVVPANEIEWFFVSLAHCVGVVVMGSVIGSIAHSIEASQSPIEKMIEQKTDIVKDITRWRAMGPELADHVIRFYSHYSRKHHAALLHDEQALLESLTVAPALRREVLKHLLGKSVALIPLFSTEHASYATDEFQLAVDPILRPMVHEPGELIFEQGSHRSSKSAPYMTLLFLCEGTVKCSTRIAGKDKTLYSIRDEGDLFGEHVLFQKTADVSAFALTRCDVFSLLLADLFVLLERFPEAREEMATHVLQCSIKHKCQRYFSLKISISEEDAKIGKGVNGAALRIQLAALRKQNRNMRLKDPKEVMPLLFLSRAEQMAAATALATVPDGDRRAPKRMATGNAPLSRASTAMASITAPLSRQGSSSSLLNRQPSSMMGLSRQKTVVGLSESLSLMHDLQPQPSQLSSPALREMREERGVRFATAEQQQQPPRQQQQPQQQPQQPQQPPPQPPPPQQQPQLPFARWSPRRTAVVQPALAAAPAVAMAAVAPAPCTASAVLPSPRVLPSPLGGTAGHEVSSSNSVVDANAVAADVARLDAKVEARLYAVDATLASLREAVDANSIALGILVQDVQARRGAQGTSA